MTIRRTAALALAGLLLGVLAWSLSRAGGAESASPTPAPHGGASQTAPGAGGSAAEVAPPVPGASSAGSSSPGASDRGTSGRAVRGGAHGGTEILPSPSSAASAAAGLPGLRPVRSTTAPLVTRPLPRPASGTGTLAVGFPAVLAPPDRDSIAVSSVSGAGDVLQAALTAGCRRPCDPLRRYRVRLAALGFTEVSVPSVENRPAAALRRGTDSVTVSVTSDAGAGDQMEYAVLAVLHTTGG